jgi:hypothetical protein
MKPFCMKMVKSTIKEREETNLVHKDLMQYLIQLRNNSVNFFLDLRQISADSHHSFI